jgi:hypothetical protein
MIFRYTASACQVGDNNCSDVGTGPVESDTSSVTIIGGGVTYFDGAVSKDTNIVINSIAGCIPEELEFTVIGSSGAVVQTASTASSCTNANLLDPVGAFVFAGYSCDGEAEAHNCYTDVTYTTTVDNAGLGVATLTEWDFIVNGETLITLAAPITLNAQDTVSLNQDFEILLCETEQYRASSNVNGVSGNANECPDTATLLIDISIGTPFPSPSPSEMPSPSPSSTPTSPPTTTPSETPTETPSVSPTAIPSLILSTLPTSTPTSSPTRTPSASPSVMPISKNCVLDVGLTCETEDGGNCSTIAGVQSIECGCPTCPSEITFRYTANECQPEDTSCVDVGSGPTDVASVTIVAGGNTYFQSMISKGSDIVINGGGACIPDEVQFL